MAESSVVIVGGGVGGVVAARELRRKLGDAVQVTVVDRQATHLFQPSLLWLMTGKRKPENITRSLDRLKRKGIEVVQAEVTAIDPSRKTVVAGGREFSGDYLVLSPGVDLAPETVPGLAEAGHNLYTLEGAGHIRDERLKVTSGEVVVLVARTPFKCPAAPYEAAMLLQDDLKRRGLAGRVSVTLYSPEPGPMPVTGAENSAKVRVMVEASGVKYFPQHTVASVDPAARKIKFQNGAETEYSLLVYIPPHRPPLMVKDSGLTGESGWVAVDRHSMETKFPGVFAIGDVTMVPLKMGLPLPKAATFAQGQAKAVAATIAAQIKSKGPEGRFDGFGECFIEAGGGRAGMGSGDFYAEPAPQVALRRVSRRWHWGKVMFERWWLWRWL
jgi:sulfide:quinone oxidoreductase